MALHILDEFSSAAGWSYCAAVDGAALPLRDVARGVGTGVGAARRGVAGLASAALGSASVPPWPLMPGSLFMMLTGGIDAAEGKSTVTDDAAGATAACAVGAPLPAAAGCVADEAIAGPEGRDLHAATCRPTKISKV